MQAGLTAVSCQEQGSQEMKLEALIPADHMANESVGVSCAEEAR